jgi:hypothetical protein
MQHRSTIDRSTSAHAPQSPAVLTEWHNPSEALQLPGRWPRATKAGTKKPTRTLCDAAAAHGRVSHRTGDQRPLQGVEVGQ